MEAITFVVAVAALALAVAGLGLQLRNRHSLPELSPTAARSRDLERHLLQLSRRLDVLASEVDAAHRGETPSAGVTASPLPRATAAISRIGLIRFDAFEDTGGAQSFALALVDDDGDGIVLTSLHSRPTTRVYIKAIRRGVADSPLSSEEERALNDAGITPDV